MLLGLRAVDVVDSSSSDVMQTSLSTWLYVQLCWRKEYTKRINLLKLSLLFESTVPFLIETRLLHWEHRKNAKFPSIDNFVNTLLHGWQVWVFGNMLVSFKNFIWDFKSLIFPKSFPMFMRKLLYKDDIVKSNLKNK